MMFVLQLILFIPCLANCAAPHVLICGGASLGGLGGGGALRYDGRRKDYDQVKTRWGSVIGTIPDRNPDPACALLLPCACSRSA